VLILGRVSVDELDPAVPTAAGEVGPGDCSVVICTHADERWDQLVLGVASVLDQHPAAREVIVVVDHNPALADRVRARFADVIVVPNPQAPGVSNARNAGIARASGEVVAFLDDDAVAAPDWLARLCDAYADPRVVCVGGEVVPIWETARPGWFPPEFHWVVGCSYRGMPAASAVVRNPIGANMSVRRWVFDEVGLFDAGFGRLGLNPAGCDETELCLRVAAALPGTQIRYEPAARVHHHVPGKRATWAYFVSRCRGEGESKALVTEVAGSGGTSSERAYVARTLPSGIAHALLRGAPRRAGAIVAGVSVTALAYLRSRIRLARG
jgi:GT2 family glycosyltransferase